MLVAESSLTAHESVHPAVQSVALRASSSLNAELDVRRLQQLPRSQDTASASSDGLEAGESSRPITKPGM